MTCKFFLRGPLALLIATTLAACGGGDGDREGSGNGTKLMAYKAGSLAAMDDVASAERNQQTSVAVLANDSVLGGGKVMLASVTAPAHGKATISGDNIVYTPAPGYFGPDSFSYTAKGTGGDTATAVVAVSVKASLVLQGRAVELPPNAAVTIVAGAATASATTDASGNYSAPLVLDTPASMVIVTVQGSGSAAHIKLISMLGDSQQAVNAAGAGGAVIPEKLPGLSVTSLSTSLYGNAILRNGGTPLATQQAFEHAARGVSYSELMQMAAVVRSLMGDAGAAATQTLPPDAADTLALVTNRALYIAFVQQGDFDKLLLAEQQLSSDMRLASLPSLAIHGSKKSLVLHNSSVCCASPANELVINPNGSGSFSRGQRSSAGTWRKGATMTLALTVPEVSREVVLDADMQNMYVDYTTREITLRQYTGTARHGFVSVTYSGTASYPSGQMPDGPFERSEIWAFDDWDNALAPADLSGAVLAGLPSLGVDPFQPGQMVVTLGADGRASSPQYPGKLNTWSIRKGKLEIALTGILADDGTLVEGIMSMGLLHVRPNGDEHWLARSTLPAGEQVHEVVIVRPQAGLAFTDANAVMSLTGDASSNLIGPRIVYTTAPDHTSSRHFIERDGVPQGQLSPPTSWAIEGGALVMRSYRMRGSSEQFATCPVGRVCTIATERIWTLLQTDAASVAVFESFRSGFLAPRYRVLRLSRN